MALLEILPVSIAIWVCFLGRQVTQVEHCLLIEAVCADGCMQSNDIMHNHLCTLFLQQNREMAGARDRHKGEGEKQYFW